MRVAVLIGFSTLVLACRGAPRTLGAGPAPAADPCPELAPAGGRPYEYLDDTQAPALGGAYRLTLVATSAGDRPVYMRMRLWLSPADSAHRDVGLAYRPLAGVVTWDDTTWRRPTLALGSGPSIGDTAEVVSGRLYLGCHGCLDAAAYELRIIAVTPNEFWGIWEVPINGSGTVLTDSANRVLPNPAGHYCARRLELLD